MMNLSARFLVVALMAIGNVISTDSNAQTQPGGAANTQRRPEVLDFEADVIEGQKKAPELFLQLDTEKADLSSVLYDRKDFNDFHAVDSKRRPKFSDPKVGAK